MRLREFGRFVEEDLCGCIWLRMVNCQECCWQIRMKWMQDHSTYICCRMVSCRSSTRQYQRDMKQYPICSGYRQEGSKGNNSHLGLCLFFWENGGFQKIYSVDCWRMIWTIVVSVSIKKEAGFLAMSDRIQTLLHDEFKPQKRLKGPLGVKCHMVIAIISGLVKQNDWCLTWNNYGAGLRKVLPGEWLTYRDRVSREIAMMLLTTNLVWFNVFKLSWIALRDIDVWKSSKLSGCGNLHHFFSSLSMIFVVIISNHAE
jgi:hypothetical protein